jgi:hypothetical protein
LDTGTNKQTGRKEMNKYDLWVDVNSGTYGVGEDITLVDWDRLSPEIRDELVKAVSDDDEATIMRITKNYLGQGE